jgi:hypothetical protein
MSMTINELCEAVMGLRPNNFMALNGAAAGVLGSSDSGSDTISQLQRATIQFADDYLAGVPANILQVSKKEVIGKIMIAMALDAITEEKADELVEALTAITKGTK